MKTTKRMRISAALGLLTAGVISATMLPVSAGIYVGKVEDDSGKALEGVMVRVTDDVSGISESVYTKPDGTFELTTSLAGKLDVRLRTPYYRDVVKTIELPSDRMVRSEVTMEAMTSDEEISESLPAGYHFGSLAFESGDDAVFNRYQFQRDCLSCHQLGNSFTRYPRSPDDWHETIIRMHLYMGGTFDAELRERRSVILSEGFDGKPLTVRPVFPLDPELSNAKIYEYRLENGSPHDTIAHPGNGLLYSVDQRYSHISVTDTKTGKTEYIPQLGKGNRFHVPGTTTDEVDSFKLMTRNAPHSLALRSDGKYYITNTATNTIGVFNVATNEWEPSFVIGGGANYPHTIRVDSKGIVWFTIAGSEVLGRLDPDSGETKLITLPYAVSGGVSGGTQPYGIAIHPHDDSVWYGRLFGDMIGRIDNETLEVDQFDSPVRGPRRMHFDDDGVLWVTGYSEGMLAKVTPRKKNFFRKKNTIKSKVYAMPEFAEGFRPAPYALGVHPDTQEIWLNENMTDRMYRFIPSEERFVVYPIPLTATYTRDFTFTPDGKACASNNPAPLASLEGGVSEILCFELR